MKILLINSPLFREKVRTPDEDYLPPLGLGYLSAQLKAAGHEVKFLDAVHHNLTPDELIRAHDDYRPHYTCMNVFTTNLGIVRELCANMPGKKVLGGPAVGDMISEIAQWPISSTTVIPGFADFSLLTFIEVNKDTRTHNGVQVYNSTADPHQSIDDLFLDRSIFADQPVTNVWEESEAHMISSRGCIYKCAFCSAGNGHRASIRGTDSLVIEIKNILSMYPGVQSVRMLDDLFIRNQMDMEKIKAMFGWNNLSWRCMAHAHVLKHLSDEQMEELQELGCREMFVGVETGSPKMRKKIGKAGSVDLVKHSIKRLGNVGISVKAYFIYGFPGETKTDMGKTSDLIEKLHAMGHVRISAFQFRPYHGTRLWKESQTSAARTEMKHTGGKWFNFESGNFSSASNEVLREHLNRAQTMSEVPAMK